MNMDNPKISEIVAKVESGDGPSLLLLQQRVDQIVTSRIASRKRSDTFEQKSVVSPTLRASAPDNSELAFHEPLFNAAFLKSISRAAAEATPVRAPGNGMTLRAVQSSVVDVTDYQPLFDEMLASNEDSHHVVISHLASVGANDPVHVMVSNGIANNTFNQDYYGEWLSGVGEILDAMDVALDVETDGFGDWLRSAGSKISEVAKKVYHAVAAVIPTVDDLTRFASAVKEMATSAVAQLLDTAKDLLALLNNAFSKGIDFVKNMLLSLLHAGWDIGKIFAKFANLASDLFHTFIDALVAVGGDVARKVVNWITTAAGDTLILAKSIYLKIQDAGRSFVDFLKQLIGTSFVEDLIKGVIGFAGKLYSDAKDVLAAAANFVVKLLEKALAAHIHLLRHFANVMGGATPKKSNKADGFGAISAGIAVAEIVAAVLGIIFAQSYPFFIISVLVLIFAPLLTEFLMGVIKEKKDKPSETFDPNKPGKVAVGDPTAKYVVFSDLHRGTNIDKELGISYTYWNSEFYAKMLQKYFDAGYILVENGDAEDFWNDSSSVLKIARQPAGPVNMPIKQDVLQEIMTAHPTVYQAISKFVATKRFVKIIGNHDMDLVGMQFKINGTSVDLWDALRIPARTGAPSSVPVSGPDKSVSRIANSVELGSQIETIVLHGHQVDDANCQDASGIGRAITTVGVFAGIVMNGVDHAGKVFGDMGAQELQAAIQKVVAAYLKIAGPTKQAEWVKNMTNGNFVGTGTPNEAAIKNYELPENPPNVLGLNCLSEVPMVQKTKEIPLNVVMGHTHKTKAFLDPESDGTKSSAFLNSGTGGMFEKVLSCVEIVGTRASVVYHAADDADQPTKSAVGALSI